MTFLHSGFTSREQQRRHMLAAIAEDAALTFLDSGRNVISPNVMSALGKVDRRRFVSDEQSYFAYENHPLPIGHGQTISQPYIVALMTDLLDLQETDRVLEIGTGSGYQTAILAELTAQVYSVEIVEALGLAARQKLASMGYQNVSLKIGDGWLGWLEHALYDAIIVTAAPNKIPPELIRQVKIGGEIVIPLGSAFGYQDLVLATKHENETLTERHVLRVYFVPLTGGENFNVIGPISTGRV